MNTKHLLASLLLTVFIVVPAVSQTVKEQFTERLARAISNGMPNSPSLFNDLFSIHQEARNKNIPLVYPNADVNSSGKVICLSITQELAEGRASIPSIPLAAETDFNGWTFEVTSDDLATDHFYLFRYSENSARELAAPIDRATIDKGTFRNSSELAKGTLLLIVTDQTPWTYRNVTPDTYFPEGKPGTPWQKWDHQDPKYRSDILLVDNGEAQNSVIHPYNTSDTKPKCTYVNVSKKQKTMKNVTLHRLAGNATVVNLMHIAFANNVVLQDITVVTDPAPHITEAVPVTMHDAAISVVNVTNLTVSDYTIQNTYSTTQTHGYGIDMNNVWKARFTRMNATGPVWGVFGNNNISSITLENCAINRFDLHMYGRDITCRNCMFRNDNYIAEITHAYDSLNYQEQNQHIYNRYASLYGKLTYENCTFDGFIPFRTDYGYNIFTGCDVTFRNCVWNIYQNKYAYFFLMGHWGAPDNERPELAQRGWHNVTIDNMTVRLQKGITNIYMFYLLDREMQRIPIVNRNIHHTSKLDISRLHFTDLSNHPVEGVTLQETNLPQHIHYAQPVKRMLDRKVLNQKTLRISY